MLQDFSRLVGELYAGCREQPMERFRGWAFDRIAAVLPHDSALWTSARVERDGSHATPHTLYLHKQPMQLVIDWAQCKDRTIFMRKLWDSPGTTMRCESARDFPSELAAHARKYRIEQILATANIDSTSHLTELISLYRDDPAKPFTEEERVFQQALVPHLVETWRLNRLHGLARFDAPAADRGAAAAMDKHGVLHLVESGFVRMLLDEWPDWRGPYLPPQMAAQLARTEGRRFVSARYVANAYPVADEMFFLKARPKSAVDNLSQRERQVADHCAAGLTYKEIARELRLSPTTVRNYLNTVYLKLGVGNKAELTNIIRDHPSS